MEMTKKEEIEWLAETNRLMRSLDPKPRKWYKRAWAWVKCYVGIHTFHSGEAGMKMHHLTCQECGEPVKEIKKLFIAYPRAGKLFRVLKGYKM